MQKLLRAASLALLIGGSVPLAAAPATACPPVIGERESMLGVVNSLGLNSQIARRCGVTELRIQHKTQAAMATLNACLSERHISTLDINAEMQRGASAGDQGYEQSGNKALMCEGVREQFAED